MNFKGLLLIIRSGLRLILRAEARRPGSVATLARCRGGSHSRLDPRVLQPLIPTFDGVVPPGSAWIICFMRVAVPSLDVEYYRQRAAAERELANQSDRANVAAIHDELARFPPNADTPSGNHNGKGQ